MNDDEVPDPGLGALSRFWLIAGALYAQSAKPLPGSTAEADESVRIGRESPPFVASGKMSAAYDAARALSLLWQEGHVHMVADYALLRAVTECAVVAWWITTAEDADERARRAFRVAVDDLRQARNRETFNVKNATTDHGLRIRTETLARVEAELARIRDEMRQSAIVVDDAFLEGQPLRMGPLLVEAERTIEDADDLEFSLLWSVSSTAAHGSLTAAEQLSVRTDAETGTIAVTNPSTVMVFAHAAAKLLNAARTSYDRYSGRVTTDTE